MTNQQGGNRCRLCGEYIGVGNTCYQFKDTGWSYHTDCWRTRHGRHRQQNRGDTTSRPSDPETRCKQIEREVEELDREIAKWLPGHVSYAEACDIEVNLPEPLL